MLHLEVVASDNGTVQVKKDLIPLLSQFFYSFSPKTLAVYSFPRWNFSITRKCAQQSKVWYKLVLLTKASCSLQLSRRMVTQSVAFSWEPLLKVVKLGKKVGSCNDAHLVASRETEDRKEF